MGHCLLCICSASEPLTLLAPHLLTDAGHAALTIASLPADSGINYDYPLSFCAELTLDRILGQSLPIVVSFWHGEAIRNAVDLSSVLPRERCCADAWLSFILLSAVTKGPS